VVLGIIEMEEAGGEEDGEGEDRSLFHVSTIIARPPAGVNSGSAVLLKWSWAD
jgi:hypothetical protein